MLFKKALQLSSLTTPGNITPSAIATAKYLILSQLEESQQ